MFDHEASKMAHLIQSEPFEHEQKDLLIFFYCNISKAWLGKIFPKGKRQPVSCIDQAWQQMSVSFEPQHGDFVMESLMVDCFVNIQICWSTLLGFSLFFSSFFFFIDDFVTKLESLAKTEQVCFGKFDKPPDKSNIYTHQFSFRKNIHLF